MEFVLLQPYKINVVTYINNHYRPGITELIHISSHTQPPFFRKYHSQKNVSKFTQSVNTSKTKVNSGFDKRPLEL